MTKFLARCCWVAAALVAACTSATASTTISADEYDRSCTADSDCVRIYVGDVCGCMACAGDAINAKDESKYENDFALRKAACVRSVMCGAEECICTNIACVSNKCAVVTCHAPNLDAGKD
jgi:hypothetical protein